ncbi:MAG: hypothetical protein ACR2PX_03420 [Endozoicomonas sp.]|uniref:hypothetical protein n=1 Tax=Endozoicomonas sp. TaxID=1892382 RepID=UPI003D9AFAC7
MYRLFIFFFTLSLPLFSHAEFSHSTHRWIAVFHPDQVESCDAELLMEKLDDLSSDATLSLVRPYSSCGIIFLSDEPLDIKTLNENPLIRYLESDGLNEIQPVMPPIN